MKSWIFGALALAMTVTTTVATACPVGGNDERPVRPIQPVNVSATELFERAQELETSATSRDQRASALDREADTLATRARALRNQAQLVAFSDRNSVIALADDLSARAASRRASASDERSRASELRAEARTLRERAVQLVRNNGGGGWRGGKGRAPVASSDTAI